MTVNIDFYILESTQQKSLFFACKLLQDFYNQAQSVYVYCASKREAENMDLLLWTFQEDSFVPHQLYDPENDIMAPIQIGYVPPTHSHDILLNLSCQLPEFFSQYKRIIEIVFADSAVQQSARDRFKEYRNKGCELNTFKSK